jgi:hypothetical protein
MYHQVSPLEKGGLRGISPSPWPSPVKGEGIRIRVFPTDLFDNIPEVVLYYMGV